MKRLKQCTVWLHKNLSTYFQDLTLYRTAMGGQNGVNHERKKAVARQVRSRYRKAGRKEKSAILDEFISTTGYKNRKYALRLLNKTARAQALLS
jgi:hypothetical protein